jgi:KRAB domain-containing zinc finger protein
MLQQHVRIRHTKIKDFKCDVPGCDHEAYTKNKLKLHVKRDHDKFREHVCPHCARAFLQNCALTWHIRVVHEGVIRKLNPCPHCDHKAKNPGQLENHLVSAHNKARQFKCPDSQCDYTAIEKCSVADHVKTAHGDIRPHMCHHCGKSFWRPYKLEEHLLRAHNREKWLKCDYKTADGKCEYATPRKSFLASHINIVHHKLKLLKCEKCDYACNGRESLNEHLGRIHKIGTSHQCPSCDYVTYISHRLTFHIKYVHDKIKDHKCSICDYATAKPKSLQAHIKQVHLKIKDLKCPHLNCDYAASAKSNITRHVRNVHDKVKEKAAPSKVDSGKKAKRRIKQPVYHTLVKDAAPAPAPARPQQAKQILSGSELKMAPAIPPQPKRSRKKSPAPQNKMQIQKILSVKLQPFLT